MADLSTKTSRKGLKTRREPHWLRLSKGHYLGFRKGPNTWIARYTDRDYKQHYKALSVIPEAGRSAFDSAKTLAEEWFEEMGSAATRAVSRGTVKDALETYISKLKHEERQATADTCLQRFELIVWSDPIADIALEDLTLEDMETWRDRLRDGRQNRTVNTYVSSVKAGLNVAHKKGHVGRPESWALPPLHDVVDQTAETTVFLTPEQRQCVINASSSACAEFIQAISFTGARPGELAAAKRRDFDGKAGTLVLKHKKGRPAIIRPRAVILGATATTFFRKIALRKLPAAPLLLDPSGNPWNRHKWADEIQASIARHNANSKDPIPHGVSAYSFRHARIAELLQLYGIDPLTVGNQTGTSVAMLEKYYYRFIGPALRDKLAAIDGSG